MLKSIKRETKTTSAYPIGVLNNLLAERNWGENILCELSRSFSHFRLVDKDTLIFAVCFSYIEALTNLKSTSMAEVIKNQLKDKNVFKSDTDSNLKTTFHIYLESPNQETLEIISNSFTHFNNFLSKIMKQRYAKYTEKKRLNDSMIPLEKEIDYVLEGNRENNVSDSLITLAAESVGMQINVWDISKSNIEVKEFKPRKFQTSAMSINLLRLNKTDFIILYKEWPLDRIINEEALGQPCNVCFYISDTRYHCGCYYHTKCLIINRLTDCLKCGPGKKLTSVCDLCQGNNCISFLCKNKCATCRNCFFKNGLICDGKNLTTEFYKYYICPCNLCNYKEYTLQSDMFCLKCKICSQNRFPSDFLQINCPYCNEIMCRKCWVDSFYRVDYDQEHLLMSSSSQNSKSENVASINYNCPNCQNWLNYLGFCISKILKIHCKNCKSDKKKYPYLDEVVCEKKDCRVCIDCQIQKFNENPTKKLCAICGLLAVKKSPWRLVYD